MILKIKRIETGAVDTKKRESALLQGTTANSVVDWSCHQERSTETERGISI